jgi:hypothetical protein
MKKPLTSSLSVGSHVVVSLVMGIRADRNQMAGVYEEWLHFSYYTK